MATHPDLISRYSDHDGRGYKQTTNAWRVAATSGGGYFTLFQVVQALSPFLHQLGCQKRQQRQQEQQQHIKAEKSILKS